MNYQQSMFTRMVQPLLEGFAWGKGAMNAEGETSTSDLDKFAETHLTADLARDLAELNLLQGGIEFINKVDAFVDRYKIFEPIREFLIDLALLQVLDHGSEDPDFLESRGWLEVEDATEDRGTELLNLLVYLRDSVENEVTPDLGDFLFEFLLVDEDEHQDEYFIYEPIIRYREMVEGKVEEIVKVGNEQKEDMEELFTPLMVFFTRAEKEPGRMTQAILNGSNIADVHGGIYRLLCSVRRILEKENA